MLFPHLYKHNKRKNRTVADALLNEQWIRNVSHDLTIPLLDEFVNLWGIIEEINFDINNQEPDTIRWTRTASGEYTAKSAYYLQFEGGILLTFLKLVWKVWAPSKCKFFMWLLLQNRLWTADHLLLREWSNCYFCPLCVRNLETAQPRSTSSWNALSPVRCGSLWVTGVTATLSIRLIGQLLRTCPPGFTI